MHKVKFSCVRKKRLNFCLKCNFNSCKMVISTRFLKTEKSQNIFVEVPPEPTKELKPF